MSSLYELNENIRNLEEIAVKLSELKEGEELRLRPKSWNDIVLESTNNEPRASIRDDSDIIIKLIDGYYNIYRSERDPTEFIQVQKCLPSWQACESPPSIVSYFSNSAPYQLRIHVGKRGENSHKS